MNKINKCLAIITLLTLFSFQAVAQEDYETVYNRLKIKIESELPQPPISTSDLNLYLSWMVIKAKDRDECEKLSYKAGREGNPYWERKFFDLSDEADNSGEHTKSDAMFKLMSLDDNPGDPGGYQQACYAAGPLVGERIYTTAIENGYITDDIRERARCMMRYATNDLEANWLYSNHESFLGYYDAEGFQVMPKGDWNVLCMRRGEFTTTSQGDPLPPADNAMKMVQPVRDICKFYGLDPEFNDATDLMVQYLKEKKVLCLWPEEGHQWYMDLAQQYELDRAKEYMEGFYATIKGKIEKKKDGEVQLVPNAEVKFLSPDDNRTWTTNSDQNGNYRIEGVILHKSCSPFILSASGEGCDKEEQVQGPLEEPDKNYELERNLVLDCEESGFSGTISMYETMGAGENQSLLAALTPGGEYNISKNWMIELSFKPVIKASKLLNYSVERAVLMSFSDEYAQTMFRMEREGRRIEGRVREKAEAGGRSLSPSECNLRLIIDTLSGQYWIRGEITVSGIEIKGKDEMDIKVKPVNEEIDEEAEGTTGIDEEVEISGTFTAANAGRLPEELKGTRDLLKEVPEEFREFLEDMGGAQTILINWNLYRKE
ncbi:carboxypeptidase regulatory-like domain-containing protein [bacterium]|nr:carboxypeptidase regulatory-like domain-containing protein [bacterium]